MQTLKPECRARILKAARNEFIINGFFGATMRTIAKRADMTVGNLYRYYDDKLDIFVAVTAETWGKSEHLRLVILTDYHLHKNNGVPSLLDKMSDYQLRSILKAFV